MREYYTLFRRKNHIKLQDVAKYINCSISLLSQFERGQANMSDEKLEMYNQFIEKFEAEEGK